MLSGQKRIARRRNIAENFNRQSRLHERYRQTDGWTTTYSEREHEFTFAKNYPSTDSLCLQDRTMNKTPCY